MDQSDTFKQGELPRTCVNRAEVQVDVLSPPIGTFDRGEYSRTGTISEEDQSIQIYYFDKYKVEVKLDPDGRLVYIKGDLTPEPPEPRKSYVPLFRIDEEFPETE